MKSVIKTMGLALAFVLFIIIVGVAVFNNPAGLSGSDYTWRQQAVIRMLNIPMPILGAVTIVIGLVTAFLERAVPHAWKWWLAGAFLFVLTGLVTRLCNQPINAVVMTWNPNAPPLDWQILRDQWWRWHLIRVVLSSAGLVLYVIGYGRGRRTVGPSER